eukprot:6186440-Pleurochrysis_carterae.AAC.1
MMHIFIQGALRCELIKGLIYLVIRKYKWIPSIAALNDSIQNFKFPDGSRHQKSLTLCAWAPTTTSLALTLR